MLRALSPRLAPRAAAAARALSIDASSLRGRDLDTLFSLSGAEVRVLLDMAKALKARLPAPSIPPSSWARKTAITVHLRFSASSHTSDRPP